MKKDASTDLNVQICANFTVNSATPGFLFWCEELGLNADIVLSPYNQILQELINPGSGLSSNQNGVSVVYLIVKDWLREIDNSKIQSDKSVEKFLEDSAREFIRAMKTHRGHCKVETMLVLCPAVQRGDDLFSDPGILAQTEALLTSALEGVPGLTILNASDFHNAYSIQEDQVHDPLREKIGHIPYQKSYFYYLATLVMRNIYRKMVPICKVVVVDCDNTLWKGVVGEVGVDGVVFEKSHTALQEKLMELSRGGVVVSLCSKNEEFDVWSVFDNRKDFKLSRDNIVSAMINWQPKSKNIKKLASQLNLGLANFIFIDDNPVECAEVQAGCPDVLTIQWPQEPDRAYTLLCHIWELDIKKGTAVDQKRTQMYKEELKRQEFMEDKVDFGDFLKSLELKTDLRDLNDEDLPRASQLTMRTNQFNFTTRRRKEGELKALMSDDNFIMQTVRVSDRFGDYGLVGFYIGEIRGQELIVDTFLLSCRVLGRGVEHYMLNELGRFADKNKIDSVRMEVFPTPRNTPAREFLKSASPQEYCKVEQDGHICSIIPTLELMEIELVHSSKEETEEKPVTKTDEKPDEFKNETIRNREAQIKRAAFELSDMKSLSELVEGGETGKEAESGKILAPLDKESLSNLVYNIFSRELKIPVADVKKGDLLEELGCDSFKIVEITVALFEKFSWLPITLLFEHRSVSDIVEAICKEGEAQTGHEPVFDFPDKREASSLHDIAVIGIGVSCSGGQTKEALWNLLSGQGSSIRKITPDRPFFLEPFEGDLEHWAGLMDDVDGFDAEFFKISPREAALTDPQTRLVLETSWKALEDAGYTGESFTEDTGVYMGAMYSDYSFRANQAANESKSLYRSWETFSIANRLSHFMGFRGPSFTVDTACSSSGTAVHVACMALRAKECRMAVAGGVNLILDPNRFGQLKRLGILSPTGRCRPFCDDSNGVLLGEGAGVVILKPLADARKDRDHVYGIIKGTALSSGTGSIGFTAPNPGAQALAISKCIRDAGIDPRTVSYVETHGTGTSLGDPIEVRGLTLAYTNKSLWDNAIQCGHACSIGSIKPNIGHLESGAAVLSLIKVLLQFEKKCLLPSITSGKLNSKIPFKDIPFNVQRDISEWEKPVFTIDGQEQEVPRRAGVSSFGVGGANVHMILEEPGRTCVKDETASALKIGPVPTLHLFPLSADTNASLMKIAEETSGYLKSRPCLDIADVCFTAGVKRRHFGNRVAFISPDLEALTNSIEQFSKGEYPAGCTVGKSDFGKNKGRIAFLFTGQGSQYVSMGRELYETSPVFKAAMDECVTVLDEWTDCPLMQVIYPDEAGQDTARIDQTLYTQLCLFCIEYALSQLWLSWGIRPDYAAGHSAGEIIALTVAGVLSLSDGLKLIHARGKLMQALPSGGKMAAVRMDEASAIALINAQEDQISIASVNGPDQVVLSGAAHALDQIVADLEKDNIDFKYLNVSHAFHSPQVEPMLEAYMKVVADIELNPPQFPVISCVDGNMLEIDKIGPEYWQAQVRQAVRFLDAMATLDEKEVSTFIEIGPHPILLGMGSLCLASDNMAWLPSLRKNKPAWQTMYGSLSRLFTMGADFTWSGLYNPEDRNKADLPGYQFHHGHYWLKTKFQSVASHAGKSDLSDSLYKVKWIESAYKTNSLSSSDKPGVWLVLSDNEDTGNALVKELKEKGHCAFKVIPGKGYNKASSDLFVIKPDVQDGFIQLFNEVAKSHGPVSGIAFLWGMKGCDKADISASDIRFFEEQYLSRLLLLSRTIHSLENMSKPKLWVVTQQTEMAALQSLMWGFGRGVALEHPGIWGGLIELASGFDIDSGIRALGRELTFPDNEDQVRLDRSGRLVPRLIREKVLSDRKVNISDQGVYLVTGGLGALGRRVILWLASCGATQIITTSRKGMESKDATGFIASVKKAGAALKVVALDIGEESEVSPFFESLASDQIPLKGIFHLAGIDIPKAVDDMSPEDLGLVLTPKVEGTWLLHQYACDFDLDAFVCFSSISSVLGSESRAHYSAANAFVDSVIGFRRKKGLPGISINWGPWDQGGMASSEDISGYARIGNYALDPDAAIKVFQTLLEADKSGMVVADIDWGIFSGIYEARRVRPLISLCRPGSDTESSAKTGTLSKWGKILLDTEPQKRKGVLIQLLSDEVGHLLGYETGHDLSIEGDFTEIGVDSLIAAELSVSIKKKFGLMDIVIIHDYPNITALADWLLTSMSEAVSQEKGLTGQKSIENRIVGYSASMEPQILEFFAKAWPNRDQDLLEPRWRWMYLESADRLGLEPVMWNYIEAGNVIAYTGAIPVNAWLDGAIVPTAWCVDTMVLKSCRDKGLGPVIMMKTRQDMPFSLSLGQTKEMRAILFSLGWQQVAPLQIYVYPLRPGNMLKGKMNALMAGAVGAGLQMLTYKKNLKARANLLDLDVREVERFSDQHDQLWDQVCHDYKYAVVRDASYLNWKYADQPGQSFKRIEMIKDDKIVAVAVLMFREPGAHTPYKYRRAFVVDLVCPISDQKLLLSIFEVIRKECDKLGFDTITFEVINKKLEAALKYFGFIRREPERFFLVHPGGVDESVHADIFQADHWLITKGDSDIDRPEGGVQ